MKLTCGIVSDLLPLYFENLLSEGVKEEVKSHLESCEACRSNYQKIQTEYKEQAEMEKNKEKRFLRKLAKAAGYSIWGTIVAVLSFIIIGIGFVAYKLSADSVLEVNDIAKYEEVMVNNTESLPSGLICFPNHLPEDIAKRGGKFYFGYREPLFDEIVEMYLEVPYTEKEYAAEVERLEHTTSVRSLLKDDGSRFDVPGYVAMDGWEDCYEYALLIGERKIAYVFLEYKSIHKLKAVPKEYISKRHYDKIKDYFLEDNYCVYVTIKNVKWEQGEAYLTRDRNRKPDETKARYYYTPFGETKFLILRTMETENNTECIERVYIGNWKNLDEIEFEDHEFPAELVGKEILGVTEEEDGMKLYIKTDNGNEEIYYLQ